MAKRKKKYLIETSAVSAALGESSSVHCAHFAETTADGSLHTSVYVRKEFILRWITKDIDLAFQIDHFDSVSDALYHL